MKQATGEVLVTLDGDGQNDPAEIPRLLAALDNFDMVAGVRADAGIRWLRLAMSRLANRVRSAYWGRSARYRLRAQGVSPGGRRIVYSHPHPLFVHGRDGSCRGISDLPARSDPPAENSRPVEIRAFRFLVEAIDRHGRRLLVLATPLSSSHRTACESGEDNPRSSQKPGS